MRHFLNCLNISEWEVYSGVLDQFMLKVIVMNLLEKAGEIQDVRRFGKMGTLMTKHYVMNDSLTLGDLGGARDM